MYRKPLNSSNVESAGYDEVNGTLEVAFVNGTLYEYYRVPQSVYEGLFRAASPGSYLSQNIKPYYQFRQIH